MTISKAQKQLDAIYGIVRKRGRCGGRPTLGDSRMTCSAIIGFVAEAYGVDFIVKQYPSVAPWQIWNVIAWALKTPEKWR